MKIIAGERKGHTLITPKGLDTRPTLSRVRESLFSIIAGDIPGSTFCDLFAGAGAVGLEALSRGADSCIFIESAREPFQCLRANIEKLRYQDQAKALSVDASKWPIPNDTGAPDIIFADPPYQPAIISKFVAHLAQSKIKPNTLVLLQTPARLRYNADFMKHLRTEVYGGTALGFYLTE